MSPFITAVVFDRFEADKQKKTLSDPRRARCASMAGEDMRSVRSNFFLLADSDRSKMLKSLKSDSPIILIIATLMPQNRL